MNVNLWFLIERAADLPNQWQVHCLELDVISYGDSPQHALMMGIEAAYMVLVGDLQAGHNPAERRAPQEAWNKLYNLIAKPKKTVSMGQLNEHQEEMRIFAAYPQLTLPTIQIVAPPCEENRELPGASIAA